jgi:hypothetical protein
VTPYRTDGLIVCGVLALVAFGQPDEDGWLQWLLDGEPGAPASPDHAGRGRT